MNPLSCCPPAVAGGYQAPPGRRMPSELGGAATEQVLYPGPHRLIHINEELAAKEEPERRPIFVVTASFNNDGETCISPNHEECSNEVQQVIADSIVVIGGPERVPGQPELELCPEGASKDVTLENVGEYVQRVARPDVCTAKCVFYRAAPGFLLQGGGRQGAKGAKKPAALNRAGSAKPARWKVPDFRPPAVRTRSRPSRPWAWGAAWPGRWARSRQLP